MALTLAPNSSTQPGKKALEQALKDFRSILSDDEKIRLDTSQKSGLPSESSVIVLTSEIDATQTTRASRRLGPRLQPFLDHVRRFTTVVDTFSQIHPVALASWGTIKLTLLLTSNFGSYFEKLSELFRQTATKTSHFQEFALLYSTSDTLQDALCTYYATVIRICQKAIIVSRKKGIFQVSKAALLSFDHDFQLLKKQLDDASEEVQIHIHVATSKVQIEEARLSQLEREKSDESRKFLIRFSTQAESEWTQMVRWREEQELRRLRKEKQQLRNKLSTIDHRVPWRQAMRHCVKDTGVWFRNDPIYIQWLKNNTFSVLSLYGSLGSGKSIVTGNVIADLNQHMSKTTAIHRVAYFFCQSERTESLNIRNLFGSIAGQLLEQTILQADSSLFDTLQSSAGSLIDADDVVEFLSSSLVTRGEHFIILDGIDQLQPEDKCKVLSLLRSLLQSMNADVGIKIMLTARRDFKDQILQTFHFAKSITIAPIHMEEDIAVYVNTMLLRKLEAGELQLTEIDLLQQIRDYLVQGSQGMFLWTKLLLEEICLCQNNEEIIQCLTTTPLQLIGIYRNILGRVSYGTPANLINSLFKWILGATRPLKTQELREALTLQPGQRRLQVDRLPHSMHSIIHCARGLIYVDEDEDTVHLVHHSLKEAMRTLATDDESSTVGKYLRLSFEELDHELGHLCMTYLLFEDFSHQLVRAETQNSNSSINVSQIIEHVTRTNVVSGYALSNAMVMLRKPKLKSAQAKTSTQSFNVEHMLRKMAEDMKTQRQRHRQSHIFRFFDYAKLAWVDHTRYCSNERKDIWILFNRLIESRDIHVDRPWETQELCPWDLSSSKTGPTYVRDQGRFLCHMYWAFENQHEGLIEFVLPQLFYGLPVGETLSILLKTLLKPPQPEHIISCIDYILSRSQHVYFRLRFNILFNVGSSVSTIDAIGSNSFVQDILGTTALKHFSAWDEVTQLIPHFDALWTFLKEVDFASNMRDTSTSWHVSTWTVHRHPKFFLERLSLFELAVLFHRTGICRLMMEKIKAWKELQGCYIFALVLGREQIADDILTITGKTQASEDDYVFGKCAGLISKCLRDNKEHFILKPSFTFGLCRFLPQHSVATLVDEAFDASHCELFKALLPMLDYESLLVTRSVHSEILAQKFHNASELRSMNYTFSRERINMKESFRQWEQSQFLDCASVVNKMVLESIYSATDAYSRECKKSRSTSDIPYSGLYRVKSLCRIYGRFAADYKRGNSFDKELNPVNIDAVIEDWFNTLSTLHREPVETRIKQLALFKIALQDVWDKSQT